MNMKKILVLVLTLTILMSTFAPALNVFANEVQKEEESTSKEPIKYVSMGESMTNGFGLDGYDTTDNPNSTNDGNHGYLEVAPEGYPAQFAAWLAGYTGEIPVSGGVPNVPFVGDKGTVELTQLATSAARAEDFLYMLYYGAEDAKEHLYMFNYGTENQGELDAWAKEDVIWSKNRWGHPNAVTGVYSELHEQRNAEVANIMQTAVKEADIISYALGNSNFAIFLLQKLTNILGMTAFGDVDEDRLSYTYMTFDNAVALIEKAFEPGDDAIELVFDVYEQGYAYMQQTGLPEEMLLEMSNYIAYTTASYLVAYKETLDYIGKVNPDVEFMIVPLINNAMDFSFDVVKDGETTEFNFGEFINIVYDPINAYLAAYPTLEQADGGFADMKFYYASLPVDENGNIEYIATFVSSMEELYGSVPENANEETYPENRLFCHSRFIDNVRGFIFPLVFGEEGAYFNQYDVRDYEIALSKGPDAFVEYLFKKENIDIDKMLNDEGYDAMNTKPVRIAQYLGIVEACFEAMNADCKINMNEIDGAALSGDGIFDMLGGSMDGIDKVIMENASNRAEQEMIDAFYNHLIKTQMIPALYDEGVFCCDDDTHVSDKHSDAFAIKYIFGLDQFDNDFDRTLHLIELAKEDFEGFKDEDIASEGLTAEAILDGHNQCLDGAEMASMIPYLPDAMSEELNGSSDLVQSLIYLYTRTMMADGLVSHPSPEGHDTLTKSLVEAYEEDYTAVDETFKNIEILIEYLKENYEQVYDFAYDYVVKEEYINKVVVALDKTLDALETVKANVNVLGLTPELEAEVLNEVNASISTVEYIKTTILSGETNTFKGLEASILVLKDDLNAHADNINRILDQAGYDVDVAVNEAIVIFETEVVPALFEMSEEFAWVAVDFLLTNIDEIYYNFPEVVEYVYAEALRTAIMVQILVGETIDYALDVACDIYCFVMQLVDEYYDDVESAILETKRIVFELYATVVSVDNALGNPSRDYLDGRSIEEFFAYLYERAMGDADWALATFKEILTDVSVIAGDEYDKALVVFGAILEGLDKAEPLAQNTIVVASQIFSYVYDFVVEDLTLAELKLTCDGLVDTIALTYENTKSVDAVGVAIYDYVIGLFDNTFTADYQLTLDSLYVSLGNATYGEELAEMLHLGDKYYSFGLTDDYLEMLVDADFVTIRLDNGEAMNFMLGQVMTYISGFGSDLDWDNYLDAEGQAALDNLLTSVSAELVTSGVADSLALKLNDLISELLGDASMIGISVNDEFVAEALVFAVESTLYAYAEAIDRLETVVDNVKEATPNAVVVITGVQNPLESLDLSKFGIDIGDFTKILDYSADIFNTQLIAIAYANDNIIFVDSVDAADIYAALTVTCVHDYDDCLDEECNICGAIRVAPGHSFTHYVSNGDATCTEHGTKTAKCDRCDATSTIQGDDPLGHKWGEWKVIEKATIFKEGCKERQCEICGEIESAIIPKTSPVLAIVLTAVVVLAVVGGVAYYRKKKANTPENEEENKK